MVDTGHYENNFVQTIIKDRGGYGVKVTRLFGHFLDYSFYNNRVTVKYRVTVNYRMTVNYRVTAKLQGDSKLQGDCKLKGDSSRQRVRARGEGGQGGSCQTASAGCHSPLSHV